MRIARPTYPGKALDWTGHPSGDIAMNKPPMLFDLFNNQSLQISLPLFVANLLLSALLAWILGRVYVKFGTTLSNRE